MVHARESRRPLLPDRLTSAERDFFLELRRLVDIAGYSFRTLEDVTSGDQSFFSKSQWGRWLNGQSLPLRRAVRMLTDQLAADDIDASHLIDLWNRAFAPGRASESPTQGPQQLPIAPSGFTGRAAELDLLTRLADRAADGQNTGTVVVAIQGTAGVGKTTLAVHLAHRIRNLFPDGQLFVNLRAFDEAVPPAAADGALLGFLESLGVEHDKIPASIDRRAALYRSMLSGRRVLVVLDNARDPDQIRGLLPASPGCLVLVTSRNEMTGLIAEGAHLLRLDPFSLAEARALLAERIDVTRAEREPDAVDELIGLCARLPLALSVAGAYAAAHPQFSLAEIAGEFRSRRLDLLDTGDPATTARSVFARSYQRLPAAAARVFRLLGTHPGPDIALAAAASLADLPAAEARKALAELTRASLLAETGPGRFACHDLLTAYAAELARQTDSEEEVGKAERRLLDYYVRTAHAAIAHTYPSRHGTPRPAPLRQTRQEDFTTYTGALAWLEAEHQVLLAAAAHAEAVGEYLCCWELCWTLAPYLHRQGLMREYLATGRLALTAAQALGDPALVGRSLFDLAHAIARTRAYEDAYGLLDRARDLFTELGDRSNLAQVHHVRSLVLDYHGRNEEALAHAHQALAMREDLGDLTGAGYSENVIAWLLVRLGRYREALEHGDRSVALLRRSDARTGLADALDTVGRAHGGIGEHLQAIACLRDAVDVYRQIGDPTGERTALVALGDQQCTAGDDDGARQSWVQALGLVGDHPHPEDAAQVIERLRGRNQMSLVPLARPLGYPPPVPDRIGDPGEREANDAPDEPGQNC